MEKKKGKMDNWFKEAMGEIRKTKQQRPLKQRLWRTTIGHYGGLFVEIPEEHFDLFKKAFPKRMFPRRVKQVDVSDPNIFTTFARQIFVQKFPDSQGKLREVFFADRSKGLRHLHKMFQGSSLVDPYADVK